MQLSSRTSPLYATLITSIGKPLWGVGLVQSNNSVLHTVSRLESLQNARGSSSSLLYERFTSAQNARGTNFPVWYRLDSIEIQDENVSRLVCCWNTHKRGLTFCLMSFVCAAPKLWNMLPIEMRSASSVGYFKTLLKTYLLIFYIYVLWL